MKRLLLTILALLCILPAVGCADAAGTAAPEDAEAEYEAVSTAISAAPETLYQANPAIDLFVCQGAACVNAADVDWVMSLELEQGELLGTIARTGVTADFQDWDATVLAEGCEIYATERADVLLAASGGVLSPYLKWVEG